MVKKKKENSGENIIRQNTVLEIEKDSAHLDAGYEQEPSLDFTIPSCGIEDVDVALHKLFDKTIGFNVKTVRTQTGSKEISKPFVIFATGERYALVKRLKPPRDKTKALILPAISIRRMSIEQSSADITNRGINQFTGKLTIKRKLDNSDRDYQNLVNKIGLKNLQGVLDGFPESKRQVGDYEYDEDVIGGGLLANSYQNNNVYEIISIPQPQFFKATYEVIFWTSYTEHMNYMIQTYLNSFLPQTRGHKLNTDKGYWFIALTEDSLSNNENFDDFTNEERIIKYTFNISVNGYLIPSEDGTGAVPVRRYLSSPTIIFDIDSISGNELTSKESLNSPPIVSNEDKFVLTDINSLDKKTEQKPTFTDEYLINKTVINPYNGKTRKKYVKILRSDQKKGETVYTASDIKTLEEYILTKK